MLDRLQDENAVTARRVRTVALILLSLTPFLIIIITRGGPTTTVTTVADATLNEIAVDPSTASATESLDPSQSSANNGDTGSPQSADIDDNSAPNDDEVGAVVVTLSSTTTLQAPRITTAGTPGSATAGPQPTLGPDASTTTVDTIDPGTVGICVFASGAVASGLRLSACQGTFTTDPDEARRLSNERRGITTTSSTSTTTTTTTTTATTTTTTSEPPTTTTTGTTSTTESTSTTAATSTTQADTTTTSIDVTPDV